MSSPGCIWTVSFQPSSDGATGVLAALVTNGVGSIVSLDSSGGAPAVPVLAAVSAAR